MKLDLNQIISFVCGLIALPCLLEQNWLAAIAFILVAQFYRGFK